MEESVLEIHVGDILHRQRIISDLLEEQFDSEIYYGPLTLEYMSDETISVVDVDDRVYTPIEIPESEDQKEVVPIVTERADNCVEQYFDEL